MATDGLDPLTEQTSEQDVYQPAEDRHPSAEPEIGNEQNATIMGLGGEGTYHAAGNTVPETDVWLYLGDAQPHPVMMPVEQLLDLNDRAHLERLATKVPARPVIRVPDEVVVLQVTKPVEYPPR